MGREWDIVVLRIYENEARTIGPSMISAPAKWPPPASGGPGKAWTMEYVGEWANHQTGFVYQF